jgi:hypothetical protein
LGGKKVQIQRTTSSGYFQKHQRTDRVLEERTRKEPAVRKAVFLNIFKKNLDLRVFTKIQTGFL